MVPFTKVSNSDLVLSGPIAPAIVFKFLREFILRLGSSDFSSSIRSPMGERGVFLLIGGVCNIKVYKKIAIK